MLKRTWFLSCVSLVLAFVGSAGVARADLIFTATLNTAPLSTAPGSSAAPFAVAFQLTDGAGTGDNNNTATLSNFTFGGGSAAGCPGNCTTTGGASGDATSTITLHDNTFFNSFAERFTAGSSLSFQVHLTTNLDAGGTPDTFAFSILDASGTPIPTQDPLGSETLLTVSIDSATPTIVGYATDPSRTTSTGAVSITMDAPVVTAVPEPGSLALTGLGMIGFAGIGRRTLRR